ncbi:MAG: NAD(P)-dependent glycerol-3-phosphate dehydrogenase [Chromatiales bacterium]|nr:MAG: NAD(P)-dependent glycerol-3-phosphate dehydrogenase [Chromatiales bacterium]
MTTTTPDIAVFGAGSWGTALAIQLARGGRATWLWGRAADEPERLARERRNQRYLPDAEFPAALQIEADFDRALTSRDLLIVVPSHAFRVVLTQVREGLRPDHRVAWATKGFEQDTGMLPHQVARDVLGDGPPLAVLSGPTFATEVGAGLPTALTVAATHPEFAAAMAERIAGPTFRTYTSQDLAGVEVGGAVKNVLAIAAGLSDGLGYGANTRIALISRGLAEMCRLGVALGAQLETFMGLSGMGDLVLTCTDNQSRNRRMGLGLAAGRAVDDVAAEIGQVVEGVYAARAVHGVAAKLGVEMPICQQVYRILYEELPVSDAVTELLNRELREEADPAWAPSAGS